MTVRLLTLLAAACLGCVAAEPAGRPAYSLSLPHGGLVEGEGDSPVVLVEFGSLLCPYCRMFHDSLYPYLDDRFISRGKLRFRYVGIDTGEAIVNVTAGVLCASSDLGGSGVVEAAFAALAESGGTDPGGADPSRLAPGRECI